MHHEPDHARAYIEHLRALLAEIDPLAIAAASKLLVEAYDNGRVVFICGNGGSASTASHLAADLGKNTAAPGRPRLRVISLNDNTALLSALANDLGYEHVFAEQISNLLQSNDVLVAISAGGNSPNVVRAAELARTRGARVVALVGFSGGRLLKLADAAVHVRGSDYGPIEDAHLAIGHMFTDAIRRRIGDMS